MRPALVLHPASVKEPIAVLSSVPLLTTQRFHCFAPGPIGLAVQAKLFGRQILPSLRLVEKNCISEIRTKPGLVFPRNLPGESCLLAEQQSIEDLEATSVIAAPAAVEAFAAIRSNPFEVPSIRQCDS